jgi:hypothetical protein
MSKKKRYDEEGNEISVYKTTKKGDALKRMGLEEIPEGRDIRPEESVTTEDLLRQIDKLKGRLKRAGSTYDEDYFLESDGTENYMKTPMGTWKTGYHPNTIKAQWTKETQPSVGRKKGSKNKKTLRQEAVSKGQFTPAEFLMEVVNDEDANINQRISAAKEAAKYYDPALSSVEVHTDEDHESPFNIYLGNMDDKDDTDKSE